MIKPHPPSVGLKSVFRSSPLPPCSLIICSRNRPRLLVDTIQSVFRGDEVPAELVIVDQSDTQHVDLSRWKPNRECDLRYLWKPSAGLSRGRNEGIAAAQHDLLVILDDDMFVAANWFGTFVRALLEAGSRTVVTGRVLATDPEVPRGFAPTVAVGETPAIYQGRIGTEVLAGGHMA